MAESIPVEENEDKKMKSNAMQHILNIFRDKEQKYKSTFKLSEVLAYGAGLLPRLKMSIRLSFYACFLNFCKDTTFFENTWGRT